MTLNQRLKQVGENPYLPNFFETPQNQYPCVTLSVGSNFVSWLAGIRRSDDREFEREVGASLSKNPLFSLSYSRFALPNWLSQLVKRIVLSCHMSNCYWFHGLHPHPLSIYFGIFLQLGDATCPRGPHLTLLV